MDGGLEARRGDLKKFGSYVKCYRISRDCLVLRLSSLLVGK